MEPMSAGSFPGVPEIDLTEGNYSDTYPTGH